MGFFKEILTEFGFEDCFVRFASPSLSESFVTKSLIFTDRSIAETTATNLEEEVTALSGAIGSATTTGYGAIGSIDRTEVELKLC